MKSISIKIITYFVFGISLFILPLCAFSQSHEFASKGQLLIPRYGLTAVTDGEWVYVIGGAHVGANGGDDYTVSGLLAAYERVDPKTLQSEFFADGLFRRANHASVFVHGGILTCGGRTQHGLDRHRTSKCEFFKPDSLKLHAFPSLPNRLRTLGMTRVGEKVFVVGGLGDGGPRERYAYSTRTYVLDTEKSEWRHVANMPLPREGVVVSKDHLIYAIGGYNGRALKSVLVFDTKTSKWGQRKDLPYELSAFAAVADGDHIFIFGDYVKQSSIHRYDIQTGELFLLKQEITPRRHLAAVIIGERVIVLGGNQDSYGIAVPTIEAFDLSALRTGGKRARSSR